MKPIDWLRAGYAAYGGGGVQDAGDLFPPEFELHQSPSIVDTAGVFRGPGALGESNREIEEAFEELVYEAEDLLEAPGGEVVVLIRVRGRGRGSGVDIDNRIAHVWAFREDGRPVRMVVYEEQAEALAAAGVTGD